jgi:hypothetical protein
VHAGQHIRPGRRELSAPAESPRGRPRERTPRERQDEGVHKLIDRAADVSGGVTV